MPDRPSRDDVRAAVRAGADLGLTASNVTDAVMPLVDQSYGAGTEAARDHLYHHLHPYRQRMKRAEHNWRNTSPEDRDAWLAYKLAKAEYDGFLAAYQHALNVAAGNADKDTGVAWPGARQSDRDGKGTE